MKINKQELVEALGIVKPGLANKEIIEQSTSFAFLGDKVITYNDEISISHPITGLDLQGAVQADNLYKFLGKIKDETLNFELKDNEILLKTGRAKAGLLLQAEIKLPLEEVSGKKQWIDLPKDFVKFMSFAMTSCSRDMSRPVLTCVHIDQSGIIEASDSYRITHCDLKEELQFNTFLLPAISAVEVVKINPTSISIGKGWVHFKAEDETIISCRIINDKFPDTTPILNVKGTRLILPQTTNEILEKAMVFAKRDHILDEMVMITIHEKKLIINAKNETSWYEEDVNMNYNGEKIVFSITPYLLKSILSETKECTISNEITKIKFEGEGWQYVTLLRKN